jgi:hypothetical protein
MRKKVHITLAEPVADNPAERQAVLDKFIHSYQFQSSTSPERLEFGILTGMLDVSLISKIKQLGEVAAVELDDEKRVF